MLLYLYIVFSFALVCTSQGYTSYSSRYDKVNILPTNEDYENLKGKMVQYRDGDILFAGMMRVHTRGVDDRCARFLEDGIQSVETFNMVVDMINADPNILPGIKIGSVMIDTCDIDNYALERVVTVFLPYFFGNSDAVTKPPLFAGVIGASSSSVSIKTASFLQIFKIPQVSMWTTTPTLSDKVRFPYFFRTVPPVSYQATAMLKLIEKEKWNYVSVVYEDDSYGLHGFREIEEAVSGFGICLAVGVKIPRYATTTDFDNIIEDLLKKKEAKAVIVFTKRLDAEKLLTAANKNEKARGYFLWIGSDGWSGQIPTPSGEDYTDSLDGAIGFIQNASVIASLAPYMANLTLGEHLMEDSNPEKYRNPWFPEYVMSKLSCNINVTCQLMDQVPEDGIVTLSKMQNVADAVLSLAYSLDKLIRQTCGGVSLCDAIKRTAGTNELANNMSTILRNISFPGINGNTFHFDKNQDGLNIYTIEHFRKIRNASSVLHKWSTNAIYVNKEITWTNPVTLLEQTDSVCAQPCDIGEAKITETTMCCWTCRMCPLEQYVANETKCGSCPLGYKPSEYRDRCTGLEISHSEFNEPHSVAMNSVAALGIIFTALIATVFFKHRDTAIVRASGKEFCFFVFIGAILCFGNSFVVSTQATVASCALSRLLISFGPTLMYSSLITKTIRVVVIFKTKSYLSEQVKKFLMPKYQILTTFLFAFLQVFVFATWLTFSLPRTTIIYSENSTVAFLTCEDTKELIILVAFAYPFMLILACTVLATINRNVPTGFKETQYIGFTMYTTCVIWLAFLSIFITNSDYIQLKIATLAISVSLSALTVLICLFGNRCYIIVFHPNTNNPRSVMYSSRPNSRNESHVTIPNSRKDLGNSSFVEDETKTRSPTVCPEPPESDMSTSSVSAK